MLVCYWLDIDYVPIQAYLVYLDYQLYLDGKVWIALVLLDILVSIDYTIIFTIGLY